MEWNFLRSSAVNIVRTMLGIYKRINLSLPALGVTFGHTLRFISFRGCGERLKRIKTKTGNYKFV